MQLYSSPYVFFFSKVYTWMLLGSSLENTIILGIQLNVSFGQGIASLTESGD